MNEVFSLKDLTEEKCIYIIQDKYVTSQMIKRTKTGNVNILIEN